MRIAVHVRIALKRSCNERGEKYSPLRFAKIKDNLPTIFTAESIAKNVRIAANPVIAVKTFERQKPQTVQNFTSNVAQVSINSSF